MNGVAIERRQVLSGSLVEGMHAAQFSPHPEFPGFGWESNSFLRVVYLVPTAIFFCTVILLPIAALIRRLRKRARTPEQRRVLRFSRGFSPLGLVAVALFVLGDVSPLPYWSPSANSVAVYGSAL